MKCSNTWLEEFENEDNIDLQNAAIEYFNNFETLAQYILSGIADEELCYKLDGRYILELIQDDLAYLAAIRDDEPNTTYKTLEKLYRLWSEKSDHDKAQRELHDSAKKYNSFKRPRSLKVVGK